MTGEKGAAYPSRVSIDGGALAANTSWIKSRLSPGAELMAVVKADAYGHGALDVARIALRHGADMLAVANIGEAAELRGLGIRAPVLVLSAVPPEMIAAAMTLKLWLTVYDMAQARQIQSAAQGGPGKLPLHLKVDTGMGRLGVAREEALALCEFLSRQDNLRLDGICTHFSTADSDPAYLSRQLARFNRVLEQLRGAGFSFRYRHAANSAALLRCPASHFNLARPGLLLYGLDPLGDGQVARQLQPVMRWTTSIAQVKNLPPGSPVGYGNTYRAQGRESIAVLPVGYADGLRRSPRTWREVLVHGKRAPLVGRVSMEKTTINVSHIPGARIGDEVTLLGRQGDEEISADEIASWIGSINYEVVTSIAPRLPRLLAAP